MSQSDQNQTPETPETETLEQENARLTSALADATSQLDARTRELRSTKHKDAFRAAALEAGVLPKAVNGLYKDSGYDPGDSDEPDPGAISAAIESAREAHDYCFKPPVVEPPVVEPPAPVLPRPTPSATGGRGKFRVSKENSMDPKLMKENKGAV